MSVDLYKPDYTFILKDLKSASEICQKMKELGIDSYTYAIRHNGVIIKIGMSADNSKTAGERIYRQAANLHGWGKIPVSTCGKDILPSIEAFEAIHNVSINRKHCTIDIWNVKNHMLILTDADKAKIMEDTLLDQYEEIHNRLPIGNPKDTRNRSSTGPMSVSAETFAEFFETKE